MAVGRRAREADTALNARIAEGFGVRGVSVEHPDQLEDAIGEAVRRDSPTFIDVRTESELTEVPPVHAWERAVGKVTG